MQVKPVASPSQIQQAPSRAAELKANAIAAFTQAASPQPQQQVVQNQSQVSVEELGAIQTRQQGNIEEDQVDTTEQTQVEEQKPAEDPALSRQFAQLARQEKALRARTQQFQQQEQALKAREQALQARETEVTSQRQVDQSKYISKDQFRQDPISALAEVGLSYDELTQQILTQQPTDPRVQRTISRLEQEISDLKAANENSQKSQAEQQTQAYQAAVKQIEMDARALVKSDPEAFEAISKTGTVREVVKLIEETYKRDGVLMTVEEAAQEVENYLVEENYNMANRIEKIKRKMQSVAPAASTSTAQTAATAPKQTQPMKTLTNATSSTRQLSAKERAILAFKGELKS